MLGYISKIIIFEKQDVIKILTNEYKSFSSQQT